MIFNRRELIQWVIYLSASILLCVTVMVQNPGAEVNLGPLLLFLYVIPIGVAAWHFGARAAFGVALVSLSAALVAFCLPQYVFVRMHDSLDIESIGRLKELLGGQVGTSMNDSLNNYIQRGGGLAELLDQKISYGSLAHLWPHPEHFRKEFIRYLLRPLFSTGLIWQIIVLIVSAPFLGILAQGGVGLRKRLLKARNRIGILEEAIKLEHTKRTLEDKEALGQATRLQSMIITISDMAREISATLQEETIFKLLLKKTEDLLKAQKIALFKPDSAGETLFWVSSIGYDLDQVRSLRIKMSEEGGIVGWCAENRLFLSMEEVVADYHKADLAKSNQLETLYCQPVVRSGELILIICVGATEKKLSHKSVARLMSTLANFGAIALDNARLLEQTRQQAIRDGLTGLYNHRYFQDYLSNRMSQAQLKGQPLTCIMIDLDYFKRLNDTHGHQAGDEVLRRVAQVLEGIVGEKNLVARYGGEEFVAVFLGKGKEEVQQIAEKMRDQIKKTQVATSGKTLSVTLSLGVAWLDPLREKTLKKDQLIKKADEALYQAKAQGRDRVIMYGDTPKHNIVKGA